MLVEGVIADRDGVRRAYVRFRKGRVIETGQIGTDSTRGRVRRIHGIVVPAPVNAHTHLADAVWTREPPHEPVEELVGSPTGLKFRLLGETPPTHKVAAMRAALRQMERFGIAATVDFREEGLEGVRLLRRAARGLPIRAVILGRPTARPVDPAELRAVLKIADGVGLSSASQEDASTRETIARMCRSLGKHFALHASEVVRESPEEYLRPRPDLLVHLTNATDDDLGQVHDAGAYVAVCPRSNALFGRSPDFSRFQAADVKVMLGTDNAMFQAPSLWRELEFAYHTSRLAHRPVSPEFLFQATFVRPWDWLHEPRNAAVGAGGTDHALILRLPTEDPYYQLVARATEHLMLRPDSRRS
ncbi:MAG: amidohydrolase family protein [Thermoplasmata archaeon]